VNLSSEEERRFLPCIWLSESRTISSEVMFESCVSDCELRAMLQHETLRLQPTDLK